MGGTWTTQSKILPGAYVNIVAKGNLPQNDSDRGIVALPLPLNFGPSNEIVRLDGTSDLSILGYDLADAELLPLKETMKRAKEVLLYRVGGGEAATVTEGELTATSKYVGTRGNSLTVSSKEAVDNAGFFEVTTFLNGTFVDKQIAKNVEDLKENKYIKFSGTGAITAFAGKPLAGGTDTQATSEDYAKCFEALQTIDFATLALPVEDEAIKIAGSEFIKRLRDDEGKKCQVVVAGYKANHEGVINVKNGVILSDGTKISKELATCWVAGATASASVVQSNTYTVYDDSTDVTERYLKSELEQALTDGEFVFIESQGKAKVLQDINSLTEFSEVKSVVLTKNRTLRVLDDIANSTRKAFENNFIGKVSNDKEGREQFKANRVSYFGNLQSVGAILDFKPEDIEVTAGEAKDAIVVNAYVQPIDAMEKLYMTVYVQ